MAKPLLYLLCTGNACRSQMAEGFARSLAGDRFDVASAGLAPSAVHPLAIEVMGEVGVDLSGHRSKAIDVDLLRRAAAVVTLCGRPTKRVPCRRPVCSACTGRCRTPRAAGSPEQRRAAFRSVRDEIRRRVQSLAQHPRLSGS